jgi:hypothetical protein
LLPLACVRAAEPRQQYGTHYDQGRGEQFAQAERLVEQQRCAEDREERRRAADGAGHGRAKTPVGLEGQQRDRGREEQSHEREDSNGGEPPSRQIRERRQQP